MQRLAAKHPDLRKDLQEKFNKDEESRAEFIRRSRGLMGNELKALIETMVKETTSECTTTNRKKHTEFLDSPDLRKRFVDKPDQLENVKKRGAAFQHPDTGGNMYQLSTFTQEHPHHHFGAMISCCLMHSRDV